MANRVLIPLDGSELGDRILERMKPIAKQGSATLELLAVIPEDASEQARKHLQRIQLKLKEEGFNAEYHIRSGDPATEILRAADQFQPELIAMSSHGRSGIARWVFGSVAERVLQRAKHPVLIANPGGLDAAPEDVAKPFKTVLVPLDGSKRGAEILPVVTEIAKAYDAEVVLLHVGPAATTGAPLVMPAIDTLPTSEEAAALIEPARVQLEKDGINVRVITAFGEPAEQILEAVAANGADLVAMATHGHTGLERWVFGSTAEKLVRHSPVPILVKRTITSNWSVPLAPADT